MDAATQMQHTSARCRQRKAYLATFFATVGVSMRSSRGKKMVTQESSVATKLPQHMSTCSAERVLDYESKTIRRRLFNDNTKL